MCSVAQNNIFPGEDTIYIPLGNKPDTRFVPLDLNEREDFKPNLSQMIHKCNPINNNREDSILAIIVAKIIFGQSELCICSLQ